MSLIGSALAVAGHAEFNRIADATGGMVFDVTDDFSSILSDIGLDIASRYFIQYKTDNPKVKSDCHLLNPAAAGFLTI